MPNKRTDQLPLNPGLTGDQLMPIADAAGILYQITVSEFNGVKKYTVTGDASYVLPAGSLLEKIIVDDDTDITLSLGSTNFGSELMLPLDITADEPKVIEINLYQKVDRTIYLTGILGNCNLTFIFKII